MTANLLRQLLRGRSARASRATREILQLPNAPGEVKRRVRAPIRHLKLVQNGRYSRIKVPPKVKDNRIVHSNVTPTPVVAPKPVTSPPVNQAIAVPESVPSTWGHRWKTWIWENFPIVILNFSSVCILFGFSRSDVLELRSLTMTGQLTFAAYNMAQATILWPSVAWSTLFASVNASMIIGILQERTAEVHMTDEQEEVFVEHFMPHGITPMQFKWIEEKATVMNVKKDEFLLCKGDTVDHVYLVVEGATHAHIWGRPLRAASTSPLTKGDQLEGGDSGAWIGEMSFLERFTDPREEEGDRTDPSHRRKKLGRGVSLYTIIADEDCRVMSWSQDDMAVLMDKSVDLRAALTRAMTSAIVGKVVNLAVTPSDDPTWTDWLKFWDRYDGASVQVERLQPTSVAEELLKDTLDVSSEDLTASYSNWLKIWEEYSEANGDVLDQELTSGAESLAHSSKSEDLTSRWNNWLQSWRANNVTKEEVQRISTALADSVGRVNLASSPSDNSAFWWLRWPRRWSNADSTSSGIYAVEDSRANE